MNETQSNPNNKQYRPPKRIFESEGVVYPRLAYYTRLDNVTNNKRQDFKVMVDNGRYFSMFAPRQSGKTTFFEGLSRQLQTDPTYIVIKLCFQNFKDASREKFYELIEDELYEQLTSRLHEVNCDKCEIINQFLKKHRLTDHFSFQKLFEELNRILRFKKIVIFIDEFDGIPGGELENFLTTLRNLYQKYKDKEHKALYSIGLIGIRNVVKLIVGGVSPFNIADHVELPPFSYRNVCDLYTQYTEETNQPFTEEAIKKVYEETAGQPWLVNRIGTLLTAYIKPETIDPIDADDVDKAIRMLLVEKNNHFDNLYEKAKLYKESFIEIVFDGIDYKPNDEDQAWLEQYGLIKNWENKAVVFNNIYKARFTKAFFDEVHANETIPPQGYELPGNRLDMNRILLDFDQYISQIGVQAFYKERKPYEKTGQFLLTAWLYQFVKGGAGELRYEVKSGLGVMDILLTYKGIKYIIETKINKQKTNTAVINGGLKQVAGKYLASESCQEGYLVIFDTFTPIGTVSEPQDYPYGDKKVTSLIIGIGKSEE